MENSKILTKGEGLFSLPIGTKRFLVENKSGLGVFEVRYYEVEDVTDLDVVSNVGDILPEGNPVLEDTVYSLDSSLAYHLKNIGGSVLVNYVTE